LPHRNEIADRTRALDDAFLFILSLVTIIFAILQATIGGPQAVLSFVPILISALVYPFYVGYIRGAILLNDVKLERARGWVSFTTGFTFYFYAAAAVLGQLLLALPVIIAGGWLTVQTARWFSRSTGFKPSVSDLGIIGASAGATLFLSLFALIVELYPKLLSTPRPITTSTYLLGLLPFIFAFPLFIVEERVIRRVIATRWKLRFSRQFDLSGSDFFRPLFYLIYGSMECWLMGMTSDWVATIAYFVSIPLLLAAADIPSWVTLIPGIIALALFCFSCFRFLKCEIRLRDPSARTGKARRSGSH